MRDNQAAVEALDLPSTSGDEPTILDAAASVEARDLGDFSDIEGARLFEQVRSRIFATQSELRVGRYRIRRRLGAGAMGEVHLAVDEELDRAIAIKFVHAHLASPRWAEGLRAEARALARLAHPNVVRVYEVGEHQGRVYLAMEYVEGGSLGDWIRAEKPGWSEVLAAYLDAARGLAAAHGAGVVHRDFKPDNVLRGRDGRVAVADFGLAALEHGSALEHDHDAVDPTPPSSTPTESRSGEVKGTPAYMPPEQFEGRGDARSDQFAFCVSLFEGLWGRRPFVKRSLMELLAGEVDWTPVPPPEGPVPTWLWPILRRGLAAEPGDRFVDMDALIRAIEDSSIARRRRARLFRTGLLTTLVGLVSGGAVAWWSVGEVVDDCAMLERELVETWDQPQREQLASRFASAAANPSEAWLADSEAPISAGLDRWRERWLSSRRELCRARVGGDPVVLDRAGACLERHRRSVQAFVDLLLDGSLDTLREAPEAVQRLDDPQGCAREAQQGGPPAPPSGQAGEVQRIRGELALVEAELLTGRHAQALAKLDQLAGSVRALEHGPLSAEHSVLRGRALLFIRPSEGFEALEQAADLAEGSRHDRVLADSWRWMAMSAATDLPDLERGRSWLRRADAAATRVGVDSLGAARLDYVRGNLDLLAKQPSAAIEQLEPALAVLEAGGDRLYAAQAASSLGVAALALGDSKRAMVLFERALEHSEGVHGSRHPKVAMAAFNLGQAALEAGEPELARTLLERAVQIWAGSEALEARDAGRAHLALAQIALAEGRPADALEHARASASVFEQTPTAGDIEHAEAAASLAMSHYFLNQPEPSIAAYRLAIARYTEAYGIDDVYTSYFRVGLGWALLAAGQLDEARVEFESGLVNIEAAAGQASPEGIDARFGLLAVDLASDQPEAARVRLAEFDPSTLAGMELLEFELFRGLVGLRVQPVDREAAAGFARARELAPQVPSGEATLAILLDSVHATLSERELAHQPPGTNPQEPTP